MNTPNGRAEIEAVFGNPAGADGNVDSNWESANIKLVAPPAGWKLYYQDGDTLSPVHGIKLHRLLEDSFTAVMTDIWNHARLMVKNRDGFDKTSAYYDQKTVELLHELRLDQHCGGYNYRKITAGSSLSLHAYGIAIDWDANNNPRQKPLKYTLPDWWYKIWANHGWIDGKHFKTPDPMHVQFATGA